MLLSSIKWKLSLLFTIRGSHLWCPQYLHNFLRQKINSFENVTAVGPNHTAFNIHSYDQVVMFQFKTFLRSGDCQKNTRELKLGTVWPHHQTMSFCMYPSGLDCSCFTCSYDKWNRQPSSSRTLALLDFVKAAREKWIERKCSKNTIQPYFVVICLVVSNYEQVTVFPSVLD